MKWLEIKVHTDIEAVEAISERLQTLGSGGVSVEDSTTPDKTIPGDFGEIVALNREDYPATGVIIKAYFSQIGKVDDLTESVTCCLLKLKEYGLEIEPATVSSKWIDEEDWENEWKSYYKPIRISTRLAIVPVWEEYTPVGEEQLIYLDPGMAFGTGTHPTTRLTLQLMEKYLQVTERVIDVGCGSGILSIAAEKLGAGDVLALDLDPVAVKNTKENCQQNQVTNVTVREGNLLMGVGTTAQMVVANILAEILLQMTHDLPRVLLPGGIFIGSGIIASKQDDVISSLQTAGLSIQEILFEEDWVAIAAKKW
jgi:ribosomal protein L11 methyltransferase